MSLGDRSVFRIEKKAYFQKILMSSNWRKLTYRGAHILIYWASVAEFV